MPTVYLAPVLAGAQFFTNAGTPLVGGQVYTYAAGTTTPQTVYTTSAGNVAHANPIILDAAGRVPSGGEVWVTSSAYKFLIQDANSVTLVTLDNISAPGSAALATASTTGVVKIGSGLAVDGAGNVTRNALVSGDIPNNAAGTTGNAGALQGYTHANSISADWDGSNLHFKVDSSVDQPVRLGQISSTAPTKLVTGNQETGYCGAGGYNSAVAGQGYYYTGVNFKTVMTNSPASITVSAAIVSANLQGTAVAGINTSGFLFSAIGTNLFVGNSYSANTYTTVGN